MSRFKVRDTDLDDAYCGWARIGSTIGRIWLRVTDDLRCFKMETFAHEVGHALGFYHVDGSAYPNSVMNTPAAASRFTDREVYHARLAYQAGRSAPYCGWPEGDNCPTRGLLGGPSMQLMGAPPIVID